MSGRNRWLLALMLALLGTMIVSASGVLAQGPPLPPGHPPTSAPTGPPPGGGATIVTPPPASGVGSRALVWTAPSGWTSVTPSSPMRRAQYKISGPGGPAECVVFYFGPGEGGDAKQNVARWADQFRRPDGKPVDSELKTREIKVGAVPVVMVEVTGTYVGGMGATAAGGDRPNHMLLGAIAKGPDANWYFRTLGPRATVEAQRATFEKMIRSIKQGK